MNKQSNQKYLSLAGMRTAFWGPNAWNFLFSSILGTYPEKIDNKNKEHIKIKKEFKNLFLSLGYIMPCVFCRESYKQFIKDLPIDLHLNSRLNLFSWFYKLKDKVNKKLIKQENECLKNENNILLKRLQDKELTKTQYKCLYEKLKKDICYTKPSPPLITVLNYYEQFRAGCNNKMKKCV
jgi:hypothetical protein